MQEDLQKLPPGFPRGAVPQPSFPPLAPVMGPMHTLMPTQSLQPTQQLEYKVHTVSSRDYSVCVDRREVGRWKWYRLSSFSHTLHTFLCGSLRSSPCYSHQPYSCLMAWGHLVEELLMEELIFSYMRSFWRGHGDLPHLWPARWGSAFLSAYICACVLIRTQRWAPLCCLKGHIGF